MQYSAKGEKDFDSSTAKRSHTVLVPAIPLDDLDPEKRKIVVDDMYQSKWITPGAPELLEDEGYRCRQRYQQEINSCLEPPGDMVRNIDNYYI